MTFTVDPALTIQLLVAFVLPLIVGFVTKRSMGSGTKAVILAGLTLVTSVLTELGRSIAGGVVFDLGLALLAALPAFVVSVGAHHGLWKPTGATETVQSIGVSDPTPARRSTDGVG